MRTSTVVVIVNILFQNTPQMSLVEDEDMIEALLSDGSHPTLGIGIGVGRLARGGILQLLVCAWLSSLVLPRIGSLAVHQFAMPAQHRFGLDYADDVTQSMRRLLVDLFQLGSEKCQRHLLSPVSPDRLTLFALHDRQLLAQNEEFSVHLAR
jgi:hypothetical protein